MGSAPCKIGIECLREHGSVIFHPVVCRVLGSSQDAIVSSFSIPLARSRPQIETARILPAFYTARKLAFDFSRRGKSSI
jgi:hypothetical protein